MKLEMVTGSSVFDLSDKIQYLHLSNNGFGLPPVEVYEEIGPLQDGATYTDYRLQPRDITIIIGTPASGINQYMALRKQLFNIFKPKRNTTLSLRLTLDTSEVRQIDCVYTEGLQADGNDKKGYYHKYAIGLRAHDPTWYDPSQVTVSFGELLPLGFTVPMTVPFSVGADELRQSIAIAYTGTFDSFPILTLVGPIDNPQITNLTTGDIIAITGTVPAGDVWTIDTRYGRKTITDQNGVSKISLYAGDLATFRLVAAEDDSASRTNTIQVTGENVTDTSRLFVQYYTRYIGV